MVLRPGLFNVARNIKYMILTNKTNSYVISHSDYENIYLDVRNSGPVTQFDFFEGMAPSFKKPVQEEESLI